MSWLTTHILNTARGEPASGLTVICEVDRDGQFQEVARGTSDTDGRLKSLFPNGEVATTGLYRLTFETGSYFRMLGERSLYPQVQILFQVELGGGHYHIPLLISPFGYTTYRGS